MKSLLLFLMGITINVTSCFAQSGVESSFKIKRKKIEIVVYNYSKDTLFLPGEVYLKILPDSAFSVVLDTLFIKLQQRLAEVDVYPKDVIVNSVYWTEMAIPRTCNRVLIFQFPKRLVKRRTIKIIVLEWDKSKTYRVVSKKE